METKRPKLLKHMVYGKSSESDRQVPLGCKSSCHQSCIRVGPLVITNAATVHNRFVAEFAVVACDLRLVDLVQEVPELREVLSSAGANAEQRTCCD